MRKKFDRLELSYGLALIDNEKLNSADDIPTRILIASTDPFYTESGADWTIKLEELVKMVENFNRNALGIKVPVNFEHYYSSPSNSTPAAGWIQSLELEEMGDRAKLYATIEWTKKGKTAIFEKEYLYHSIGFYFNYVSPKDGKTEYGPTLYELTLTNNPVNTNLGEFLENSKKTTEEDSNMNEKELKAEIERLKGQIAELKKDNETKIVELSRSNDGTKKLKEDLEKANKELAESKDKLELSKRESELDKLILDKKISPAQREQALKLSAAEYVGFKSFAENSKANAYEGEANSQGNEPSGDGGEPNVQQNAKSPDEQVDEMARKLMKEDKEMKYKDAVAQVLKKNKALAERYNKAQ